MTAVKKKTAIASAVVSCAADRVRRRAPENARKTQSAVTLSMIAAEDLSATTLAAQRLAKRMKVVLATDGVNLINACGAAAWQTVFHFHIHVVPRYEDDPLKLPWIPEPGDSDEIAAMAAKLRGENG